MTHVLVPVEILEGETVSAGLIDMLGTADVTVLGYHEIPEQTPPDQARAQFEERAVSALEDIVEEFEAAGGDADHRLVFTHKKNQSIQRIAGELDTDAFAITGATGEVERLLVTISGDVAVQRILQFVTDIIGNRDIGVTLLLAVKKQSDDATELLERAGEVLSAAGIDVSTKQVEGRPFDQIVEAAPEHDVVVMGEQAPSLTSFLFGDEAERVAAASVGPVLVVRRRPPEADSDGSTEEE